MLTDRAQGSGGHAECSSWGRGLVVPLPLCSAAVAPAESWLFAFLCVKAKILFRFLSVGENRY